MFAAFSSISAAGAAPLVFEGDHGPGKGKHIVFLAGDHEYRSEESLPELARILAKHHGFKCTVLFDIDKSSGEIAIGNSNMPDMDALDTADLAVVFLRFQDFPAEQMKHLDAYLNRGGPVVGMRTATHAFKMPAADPFAKYSFDHKGDEYKLGFGHQVLGQTWVGHYGRNHQQSTRITIVDDKKSHPILRGVKDIWVQAGAYVGKPTDGEILTMAQPLNGMQADSPVDATKPPMPSEWTRSYKSASGKSGRAFTSLYGTPEDFLNDGYRRMMVNGCFWALGLDDAIKPDANIAFVGPFKPNTFGNAYARGVKPEMYAGFESPIPANNNVSEPDSTKKNVDKKNVDKKNVDKMNVDKKNLNSRVPDKKAAAESGTAVKTAALAENDANQAAAAKSAATVAAPAGDSKPARYVRIELPGASRILTLAEVEVYSGGKNVAPGGKASQSSTNAGGVASKAIDGNKDSDYTKGGQTHTNNDGEKDPWWEVDLGKAVDVEKIGVWNRSGFEARLSDFTVVLLDADRKPVFQLAGIHAPQALEIDVKNGGKLTYLDYSGKPGKPFSGEAAVAKDDAKKKGGKPKIKEEKPKDATLVDVPADYRDPLPFAFKKGDTVAMLGNGLPDRMQHDGWLETLLQSQLADQQVRFRNMSASGDRPNSYPRSSGQLSMAAYLQKVKPDVIFAFFGYNESYEGKPDDYKQQLIDFVKKTRAAKPNGSSFPRIVLFSPIAHENLHSPNVPDGKAHNKQLEAYTAATQAAAKEVGVGFVDLFHPTLALYKAAKTPLTINGVHLSEDGDRQLAEVIAKELLGKAVSSATTSLATLRQAVLDKDLHWWNRYRASDGNDVWGSRSILKFTNDQSNADVLQPELVALDVLTANRDERVWALAAGRDLTIDDSNVPKAVPVVSNVGGGSKSSSAVKEGSLKYMSGEEGLKSMAVAKGFKVNLFADEARFPQLIKPVQMQFDTQGRLWVATWPSYPKWEPHQPLTDAILIVHDDDGDGVADRVTEFAKVQNPLGFEFWNGGVLVTCQSELLFLKDTKGDGVADVRIVMLQGLDSSDTHHGANNLIYGPDGGIYWQSGVFMQHNYEHPWGPSLQAAASAMYRFDPRRFTISMHATNSPNPHGIAFDYWGYHYATDGTGGRAYQVRPEGNGFKMHELLKKEVRPVTSSEIVSSANFPESMQGDFLICNVIGFLGIKHYHLERNPETGAVWGEPAGEPLTVQVENADGSKTEDKSRGLLMSGDKNFRPSDAIFAPDGSLYFSDWQNVIIGHMQHNARDPNRDHTHGRIYRMVYTDRPLQKPVAIAGQPIPALLENLKSPIDGIRHRTRIELSGRDSTEVIAATREWIKKFDPNKKEDAHNLLEALWLFQQHNVKNFELLDQLLKSPEPHARIAAKTVQHFWLDVEKTYRGGVIAGESLDLTQKSGILTNTPQLTTIRVATVPEKMMYDVKELTVTPGKKVKLTFANQDFMPHNILLVKPGKADDVGLKAIALGAKGFDVGFIPESSDILWHSHLVDHGQEEVLEFTAPTEEGAYPYLCSFPGHHRIMRGMLYVTNNLKEFLVKHPPEEIKITQWKHSDFTDDFKRVGEHRSYAEGKQLFSTLGCAQCHKLNKDDAAGGITMTGGGHNSVGPNVDDTVKKYKGDAKAVLLEVLEPSRTIDDKFKQSILELEDGTSRTGIILAEDSTSLTILAGTPAKEQKIEKKNIDSRRTSPVSIMPAGLLNTLDKEQILDLLAYLMADGNADDPAFKHHH